MVVSNRVHLIWFAAAILFCGIPAGCSSTKSGKAPGEMPLTGAGEKAARQMVAAAEEATARVVALEKSQPLTLVFVDLTIEWSRNLANAQALVAASDVDRRKALEGHLDRMTTLAADV